MEQCIESIIHQTFRDFEIILVDDGSSDSSGTICDNYAARDKRIAVIHQSNAGVTAARRCGVSHSSGQYITFVDADDYLPLHAIELLYDQCRNGKCDIVCGRIDRGYHTTNQEFTPQEYQRITISGKIVDCGVMAKLFGKHLFTGHTFDIPRDIVKGEDALMNIRLAFQNANPVKVIDNIVYHYRPNQNGCISTFQDSQDYEAKYHTHRLQSIPHNLTDQFEQELIDIRINALFNILQHDIAEAFRPTHFRASLVADAKHLHRKLYPLEWTMLHTDKPYIARFYIACQKLKTSILSLPR